MAPTERHYDLIIIGSGSGNTILDERWKDRKVAIVDGGIFGGTCLNVGCIPTKMYAYPAATALHGLDLDRLGVRMRRESVDWPAIRDRIFGRIDPISAGGLDYRESQPWVDVYTEYGRLLDPHTLRTDSGAVLHGDQMVYAAGSRSLLPDVPGMDLPGVHTSDTIMRIDELPGRVVVIGGGFIAAEFATIFTGLGSQVVQLNRSERLLRSHDAQIAQRFREAAARRWELRTDARTTRIRREDGELVLEVAGEGAPADGLLRADAVLVATGRRSNADRLGAAEAGLDVEDGVLKVDQYQRVLADGRPQEGIWALGDVCSRVQLKHLANAQARTVAHNLWAPEDLWATDERFVPEAVFSDPQVASVGLTEDQARERARREGFEITVKVQDYGDVAYGWAMEDTVGLVKLIARQDTGELLGAHLVGAEASILIQPLVQAMSFGLDAHSMARGQYWPHPALSEVVENALLGLDVPGQR